MRLKPDNVKIKTGSELSELKNFNIIIEPPKKTEVKKDTIIIIGDKKTKTNNETSLF